MAQNLFSDIAEQVSTERSEKGIEKSSFLQVLAAVVIGVVGLHVALNDLR